MSYWNTSLLAKGQTIFFRRLGGVQCWPQADQLYPKNSCKKTWAAEHSSRWQPTAVCRTYWALQVGMVGGQTGFSARSGETVADNANTATAIQSNVFFTVKLLVEVEVAP